jgi:acetyl-CoA carboxylase alpha subunit
MRQYRNSGWQIRRYRKALRLMKMAENLVFRLTLILRSLSWFRSRGAWAREIFIFEMIRLKSLSSP